MDTSIYPRSSSAASRTGTAGRGSPHSPSVYMPHIPSYPRQKVMDTLIYPLAKQNPFQLCSIPLRYRSVWFSILSISMLSFPCLVVICFGACHSMSIVVRWIVPGVEGAAFYLEPVGEDEVDSDRILGRPGVGVGGLAKGGRGRGSVGRVSTAQALGRVDWDVAADRLRALFRMKIRVEDDHVQEPVCRCRSCIILVIRGYLSISGSYIWDQTTAAVRQ